MGELIDAGKHDIVVTVRGQDVAVYAGGIKQQAVQELKLHYTAADGLQWFIAKSNGRSGDK